MTNENFPMPVTGWPGRPVSITPSDSTALVDTVEWIYLGTAGSLRVRSPLGYDLTFSSLPVGLHPISATLIYSTGTSASGIIGFVTGLRQLRRWRQVDLTQIPDWSTHGYVPSDILGFERSTDGYWRANANLLQQLPSDWRTNFTKVYVDPVRGSDTNSGSTSDLAVKNLWKAIQLSQTLPKAVILVADGARFQYGSTGVGGPWSNANRQTPGSGTTAGYKTIIMPVSAFENDGVSSSYWTSSLEIGIATPWATYSGSVFRTTINTDTASPNLSYPSPPYSGMVFDSSIDDGYGLAMRYVAVGSVALVGQTAYSYFVDTANRYVYVNTCSTELSSTNGIRVFNSTSTNGYLNFNDREVYVVNGIFEGGFCPFYVAPKSGGDSGGLKLRMYNCSFLYSYGNRQGFLLNGSPGSGEIVDIGLYNCTIAGNGQDGVSYKGNCIFVESQCVAYANGIGKNKNASYGICNGFTTHNETKGIRVDCTAFGNAGPNYADSASGGKCAVLNLGCASYNSTGDGADPEMQVDFALIGFTSAHSGTGPALQWILDGRFCDRDGLSSNSRTAISIDADNTSGSFTTKLYTTDDLPTRRFYRNNASAANIIRIAVPE